MKTSPPTWRCRLHRLLSLRPGPGPGRIPTWLATHQASCDRCRARVDQDEALGAQLRAGALRERRSPSPYLAARIAATLERAPALPPATPSLGRWLGWAAAGAFAVGLAVFLPSRPPTPPASLEVVEFAREQAALVARRVEALPRPDGMPLTHLDRPLQAELDAIIADARKAAVSIAQVCLPSQPILPDR